MGIMPDLNLWNKIMSLMTCDVPEVVSQVL